LNGFVGVLVGALVGAVAGGVLGGHCRRQPEEPTAKSKGGIGEPRGQSVSESGHRNSPRPARCAKGAGVDDARRVGGKAKCDSQRTVGLGLTIRPSRRRFAARLNSGVRAHGQPYGVRSLSALLCRYAGRPNKGLAALSVCWPQARIRETDIAGQRVRKRCGGFVAAGFRARLFQPGIAARASAILRPAGLAVASVGPNNSSKPTPLRGAA
jgi:hypothetical protein